MDYIPAGRYHDISGMRAGKLVAIKPYEAGNNGGLKWLCKCDCGNETTKPTVREITNNLRVSCGKCEKPPRKSRTKLNVGEVYSFWTVSNENPIKGKFSWEWQCQCVCGKKKYIPGHLLKAGKTRSCGCKRKEVIAQTYTEKRNISGKRDSAFRQVVTSYRWSAKNKGLSWNINDDDIYKFTNQNCNYCGAKPGIISRVGYMMYIYNGMDRVDNNKGYEVDNIVPCCSNCNYMKRAMEKSQFLNQIIKIYNNLNLGRDNL